MQIIQRHTRKGRTSECLCFAETAVRYVKFPTHKQNGAALPRVMTCNGYDLWFVFEFLKKHLKEAEVYS